MGCAPAKLLLDSDPAEKNGCGESGYNFTGCRFTPELFVFSFNFTKGRLSSDPWLCVFMLQNFILENSSRIFLSCRENILLIILAQKKIEMTHKQIVLLLSTYFTLAASALFFFSKETGIFFGVAVDQHLANAAR